MKIQTLTYGYKINGRFIPSLDRIARLAVVSKSTVEGETVSGVKFKIEGGRHAGGSRTDWFLDFGPEGSKSIVCTSLVDALRCIANA